MRTIDIERFKREFRAAAARRGIDPAAGATSYQAALVQADLRRAATLAAADYGWWRGRDIEGAAEATPRWEHVRVIRTDPERLIQTERESDLIPLDDAAIAELWREVRRELRAELRQVTRLKTIHQRQTAGMMRQEVEPGSTRQPLDIRNFVLG